MSLFVSAALRRLALCCAFTLMSALPSQAQFQRVLGMDAHGMQRPMPAFSVAVPQGWQPKGGVVWRNQGLCNRYGFDISWAALSPDERFGVAILPALRWTSSAQAGPQGCPVMQIGSARDAIAAIVARMLPQAQMIDYRPRPDFFENSGVQTGQTDLGFGSWMRNHVDGGEALFSFKSDKGEDMRLSLALMLVAFETNISGGGVIADTRFVQGESQPAWLAYAPAGALDFAVSEQMRTSIEFNPEWKQEILKHRQIIDRDTAKTQTEIARINRDTNAEISRLNQQGHEERMRIMDRGRQQFSDLTLERDNWRDTDGSRLNAPMGGDNMWRLDDGSYVSTNDHNFNPLEATGQFGTQLERWE